MKLETYEDLKEVKPQNILTHEVFKGAKRTMKEYDVLKAQLAGMETLKLAERDIVLPGFSRNFSFLMKVVADYVDDKGDLYRPPEFAGTDQITTQFLRPQHFNYQEWRRDVSLTGTTLEAQIIPKTNDGSTFGLGSDPPSTVNDLRFVITDFIDYAADSPVRDIKIDDEDGESRYTNTVVKELNASDLHIITLDYPLYATTTIDVDALVYSHTSGATVTHELTPIGLWIGYGEDVPSLCEGSTCT